MGRRKGEASQLRPLRCTELFRAEAQLGRQGGGRVAVVGLAPAQVCSLTAEKSMVSGGV